MIAMHPVLAVDCSGAPALAISRGPGEFLEAAAGESGGRSDALASSVAALLAQAGLQPSELAALVVGAGPGSFTGLRIAFSFLKGMALSLERPLAALSSLAAYAYEFRSEAELLIALSDARRNECFCAAYLSCGFEEVRSASIVPRGKVNAWIAELAESFSLGRHDVIVSAPDGEAVESHRVCHPRHVARSLIEAALSSRGIPAVFSVGGVAEQTPHYVRAAAAKTIEERSRERLTASPHQGTQERPKSAV